MGDRKKILFTCGACAVTSAVIKRSAEDWPRSKAGRISDVSCNAREVANYLQGVAPVITTPATRGVEGVPVLQGIPFKSGIGEEQLAEELIKLFS
jgi:PTS system galactitol-specific IIB component